MQIMSEDLRKEELARAQPQNVEGDLDDWIKAAAAKDYDGLLVQFKAMKCLLNSQGERLSWYANKDYSLGEARLKELNASLESEREMNAELTAEIEKLSPPNPEPSGDVKAALDDLCKKFIAECNHDARWMELPSEHIRMVIEWVFEYKIDVLRSALAQQPDVNQELLGVLKECLPRIEELRLVDLGAVRDAEMQDYQERKIMARRTLAETNELINKINEAIALTEQKGGV